MPGIVITGGPGSGKSTLLNALQIDGFNVIPEVSRGLIREQVAAGGGNLPWLDLDGFARLCLGKMIADFESVSPQNITFFDRGIPDILAYLKAGRLVPGPSYLQACTHYRYAATVFAAPPWEEIYVNDAERWQTYKEAVQLYYAICDVYSREGYHIVELPLATVDERVAFIKETLGPCI